MIFVEHRDLEMRPGGMPPVIHVSQYDEMTDAIMFRLLLDGDPFTVDVDSATVQGTKADRKGFSYDAKLSKQTSGGVIIQVDVIIDLKKQMTAYPGQVYCDLSVKKGTDVCYTAAFILQVKPAGLADDIDISDTDIPAYIDAAQIAAGEAAASAVLAGQKAGDAADSADTATIKAGQASANASNAYNSARDAEAWANGTRGGTAIPSTDPAYEKNAKYYADLAGRTLPAGTTVAFWIDSTTGHLWEQQTIDGVQQTAQDLGQVKGSDSKSETQVTSYYTSEINNLPISTVNARVCGNMTQLDFTINCQASNTVPEGETLFATLNDYMNHKELRPYSSGVDMTSCRLTNSLKVVDLPGAMNISLASNGKVYISAEAGGFSFPTGASLKFSFMFINNK